MRSVRLYGGCMALMLLSACQAEPDFDETFDRRSRELTEQASQIQAEADAQLAAAREAETALGERDEPAPSSRQ